MEYVKTTENIELRDNLIAGGFPASISNVSLAGGAEIERGMLLCGENGVYQPVTSAADAKKDLVLASDDATSDATVASAYISGRFCTNKIKVGELDIEDFREPLRKSSIFLTTKQGVGE